MIFYFTASGNSKYVADRLAYATGEKTRSITKCLQTGQLDFEIPSGENVGFVCPVYSWSLPSIVWDFFEKVRFKTAADPYFYYVTTYGTISGDTGRAAKKELRKKGFVLQAQYSVKMPDTWTVIFDLSDKEKVQKNNKRAEEAIDSVIAKVKEQATGDYMERELPDFLAAIGRKKYEKDRQTSHLHVDKEKCISCGLCAKDCPIKAIEMQEEHPVWVKEKCVMCLRCLHHCPVFAIQYDQKTQHHGQYVHKRFSRIRYEKEHDLR